MSTKEETVFSAGIKTAVPFYELFDAFLDSDFRAVAEILFERSRVRPGRHNVALLHFLHIQNRLFAGDFFDGADEIQQLDRTAVPDVVEAVLRFFWRLRDDSADTLDDVVCR